MKLFVQVIIITCLTLSLGSCKSKTTMSQKVNLGMTKEQVLKTLGKPYKTSARYDEYEDVIDVLYYREKTQDVWSGITTINSHIFVFRNEKLIAIEQGDEHNFKEPNHPHHY